MLRAIYPGSFDPVTYGHLDIIERAARISDELIVGVLQNKAKSPLFSVEERVTILSEVTKNLKNVKIVPFEGLLIDFAKLIISEFPESELTELEFSEMSNRAMRELLEDESNGIMARLSEKI